MDTSIFTALLEQVIHSPGSLLIILVVSLLGFVLETWCGVKNRLVSAACCVIGMILYPVFVSKTSVDPHYPNPFAVLLAFGFVVGFIAAIAHATVVGWVIKKFSFGADKQNAGNPGSTEKDSHE